MTSVIEVMKSLGIEAKETIKNKIVVPDLPHVFASEKARLIPLVITINSALKDAGLLDKPWRAKISGTTALRWILVIGK